MSLKSLPIIKKIKRKIKIKNLKVRKRTTLAQPKIVMERPGTGPSDVWPENILKFVLRVG